jgi:glycerol uptake facilitator protein
MAEFMGTYLLVLLGCGAVHAAVLTGAQSGLWQVAIVWGIAIMLAVYTVGSTSGAHINPAITVALAAWGGFPWRRVLPYCAVQVMGAFCAAATLFVLFNPYLKLREHDKQVIRGQAGSEITAMCYGEYFPSPGPLSNAPGPYSLDDHEQLNALVPEPAAFLAEVLGTMILAVVVFAVTDEQNRSAPPSGLAPVFIGLAVAALISVIAPLTQACFNPARDFGPRLFAFVAGWGSIALPGPRGMGFVTVYIVAPIFGATLGGALYRYVLQRS